MEKKFYTIKNVYLVANSPGEKSCDTMQDTLVHLAFSILFLIFLFERGYFQLKSRIRSRKGSKYLEGKKIQLVLIIIGQIWIIGIFLYIVFPETHEWFILGLPSWLTIVGLVLTVIGMIFEFYTQLSLGKHFSAYLHIREDHKLISNGPYRFIRHPMYTALTMVLLGLFFTSSNIYVGLPLPVFLVVIALRVGKEENVLVEQFGDEYRNYMIRTGRFLPKIRFKSDD